MTTAGLFSPELLDEIVDVNPALDLAPLRHSSARQLCVLEITEVREWSVDGTFDCAIIGSSTWDKGCWDGQIPTGAGGVFAGGGSGRLRAVPGQWPTVEPALPIGRTRHGRSRHGCGGVDAWRKADTEVPESEFEGTGSIPMDSQVDDATARPTDPDARGCKTPAGWHTSFRTGAWCS